MLDGFVEDPQGLNEVRVEHCHPLLKLFELLLERGAEPFAIQVLYNTHFSGDVLWWLALVYEHTIHTPSLAA